MAIPGAASAGPDGVPTDVVPAKPEVLHLPDLDKMSPKAAVQFFVEMEGYPDAQRMMDEYDVAELEAILGAVLDYGKKQYGDGFQVAGVEYADDETNDGKEKKLNARTKMALDLLKMDLGSVKPAEPAPTPPSAPDGDVDDHDDHDHGGDDAETGPDADGDGEKSKTTEVVETAAKAKEDAEGQFAAFSDEAEEILSGDGSFFDKSSKVMELAGEHGTDFLDSVGEARDAAMKAMEENQDKGGFAAFTAGLSAFMKTLSASMGSRLEKRKKKKEKKESKESVERIAAVCDAFGFPESVDVAVTSGYGPRLTPKKFTGDGPRTKEWHGGIDMSAAAGTPILARQKCQIKWISAGTIQLKSKGKEYKLTHIKANLIPADQRGDWVKIKKGEKITEIGETDSASTGPHLHLSRVDGKDPSKDGYTSEIVADENRQRRQANEKKIKDLGDIKVTSRKYHTNDQQYFS